MLLSGVPGPPSFQRGDMTYCFKCLSCGDRVERHSRETPPHDCPSAEGARVVRDYSTENVGIGTGVRESRNELTTSGYRDLFLPTADDMATADDPSGQKGLREWAETHTPKDDNKRPAWPVMEKTQF